MIIFRKTHEQESVVIEESQSETGEKSQVRPGNGQKN
jgi:hypothetical protein